MAILPITVYGDKILREKTKDIEQIDDNLIATIHSMFKTMKNANGIGLAANQVDLDKSVFVVDVSPVEGYEDHSPRIMINPEILETSDENVVMEEGCLSLPNLRSDVERPKEIKVKYLDTDENEQEEDFDDLMARVILHEYDHLIGKLIPDRVDPQVKRKMQKQLVKMLRRDVDVDYPITEKSK
jgi:peptide deformylase